MAQLSDDCFAFGGALLPLDDAQARVAALHACVAGREEVALEAATGRILAADFIAPIDLPPQTNSAVDGYAVTHADLLADRPTLLPLFGRTAAGHAPAGPVPRGHASRIFTGAVMPEGPDTVMMQEDCEATDAGVVVQPGIRRGANRRPAGEDVARGAMALPGGRRLMPPDIGLLAALGMGRVTVRTPLRVALFSTGDEIIDPPAPLAPGRVYDANRFMLAALLRRLGASVLDGGILPDDRRATQEALAAAAGRADLMLTSGGVSTGEEDHVRAAIAAAGSLAFWRVAIKPGRPVALGEVAGTPLLGLPGNPVAALVTFAALGRPLLDRLAGAVYAPPSRFAVASGFAYRKKAGRREYVRVQIGADGIARRYPKEGAGIITSLTESDALMELPEDMTELAPGDVAPCIPMGLLHG
ncbi:molybdopterin molybdotransferase MoeA [Limobrevibacterium gyesilva]|uniref:Molybdopterin molybdenumtransferase n=1 Tax=Limobrevibacterium gyesilva TaxID=2991712 RepID=A0AA41YPB0_9PROT|nr:gephyrin-like molybdotransferase Glp [Limobrevibacterium gyesilva]MCW3474025.1 molybdopterin molybdotransferase MoeA [Limobrevibacterium gyesilva]